MRMAERIFVGTDGGLYRLDADTGPPRIAAQLLVGKALIALIATDAETLLVGLADGGALQSFDGGATWLDAPGQSPMPVGRQVLTRHGVGAPPYRQLSDATAYARLEGRPPLLLGAGAGGMQLFRSSDDGIHWEAAGMPSEPVGRITTLAPSATRPTRCWAGTDAGLLLESTDGGQRWTIALRLEAAIRCLAVLTAETAPR
jgi:photosystem II stability/assembly factor-like uncharacterized protein